MSKVDVLRKSRDEIATAIAGDAAKLGAQTTSNKIDAFLNPILEEADKLREEQQSKAASVASVSEFRPEEKLGERERWIEEDDVGVVTFHSNGVTVTTDQALQRLAGMRGKKPEEVRRKIWLKYLRETQPLLWQEFVNVAKAGGPPKVVERKLHDVLERSKKLNPVNPWNPVEPGKIIVG
jgi:hypothetical protein